MSFFPCSQCGQRERGKLAAVYANWFDDSGDREAWRQRLCVACLTDLMGGLKNGTSADSSVLTACPSCGSDASQTLNGIYLTIYPPKQSEREYALTMCGSCGPILRQRLSTNADRLGDRNAGAAAPANAPSAAWDSVPW
jgi:RNase P subunit RPR2